MLATIAIAATVAAFVLTWAGASLMTLGDGERELALGLAAASVGLGLAVVVARPLAWSWTASTQMGCALALAGVASGAARVRGGLPRWGLMPAGSTPRLTLVFLAAPVGGWLGWIALGRGPAAAVATALFLGVTRLATCRNLSIALASASLVALALAAEAWALHVPTWGMAVAPAIAFGVSAFSTGGGGADRRMPPGGRPERGVLLMGGIIALGAVVMAAAADDVPAWTSILVLPSISGLVTICGLGALSLLVALAPAQHRRQTVVAALLAALALGFISTAPDPLVVALVILGLACAQASWLPAGGFIRRLRWPAAGSVLLGCAFPLALALGPGSGQRLVGVALALGVIAVAGVVPFLQDLDPEEPPALSSLPWLAVVGPLTAAVVVTQSLALPADAVSPLEPVVLIGLGLVNLLWGLVGAWRPESPVQAWRYSFLADWGLVLIGLGMLVSNGLAGALLVTVWMVLARLPLAIVAAASAGSERSTTSPGRSAVAGLLGMALVGAAPFAGFPARVLLLRGASSFSWPLAAVLGLAMVGWLGHGFRLGRTIDLGSRRAAAAVLLALGIGLLLGLYPQLVLRLAGLP